MQASLEHNLNSTNSILNFIPNIEDTGKFLKCRAENLEMTASQIEDSWNLDIDCEWDNYFINPTLGFISVNVFTS